MAETRQRWLITIDQSNLKKILEGLRKSPSPNNERRADLLETFVTELLEGKDYELNFLEALWTFWPTYCEQHGLTDMLKAREFQLRLHPGSRPPVGNLSFGGRALGTLRLVGREPGFDPVEHRALPEELRH